MAGIAANVDKSKAYCEIRSAVPDELRNMANDRDPSIPPLLRLGP
jgi:hypothetical protein